MTDTSILKEPPPAGTELDNLVGTLERNRRVLAWKCADLDAEAMGRTVGASAITLGGLLRHLTQVESDVFDFRLHDQAPVGCTDDAGWSWTGTEDVSQVWSEWQAAVERSRAQLAAAVAAGGLDWTGGHEFAGWGVPSARRLLADMIEEYARHTGHADLIRETIDGRVGEDAPL